MVIFTGNKKMRANIVTSLLAISIFLVVPLNSTKLSISMNDGPTNFTSAKNRHEIKKSFSNPASESVEYLTFIMEPDHTIAHSASDFEYEGGDMEVTLIGGGVGTNYVEYKIHTMNVSSYKIKNGMWSE